MTKIGVQMKGSNNQVPPDEGLNFLMEMGMI